MKKQDVVFTALFSLSLILLGLNAVYNITTNGLSTEDDRPNPARTEALKQKLKAMGLELHDAQYWKNL